MKCLDVEVAKHSKDQKTEFPPSSPTKTRAGPLSPGRCVHRGYWIQSYLRTGDWIPGCEKWCMKRSLHQTLLMGQKSGKLSS